jgi:hypothetical protein
MIGIESYGKSKGRESSHAFGLGKPSLAVLGGLVMTVSLVEEYLQVRSAMQHKSHH